MRCTAGGASSWICTSAAIPTRVEDLLVGHSAILRPERSSTRVRVHLNRKDLQLLSRAQRLVEHTRTGFIATGDGPPPEHQAGQTAEHATATRGMPRDMQRSSPTWRDANPTARGVRRRERDDASAMPDARAPLHWTSSPGRAARAHQTSPKRRRGFRGFGDTAPRKPRDDNDLHASGRRDLNPRPPEPDTPGRQRKPLSRSDLAAH